MTMALTDEDKAWLVDTIGKIVQGAVAEIKQDIGYVSEQLVQTEATVRSVQGTVDGLNVRGVRRDSRDAKIERRLYQIEVKVGLAKPQ